MNHSAEFEAEKNRLESRIDKLAAEKAYLRLLIHLMEQINTLPGVDGLIQTLLQTLGATLGGTQIKLYYRIDAQIYYADLYGARAVLDQIDDQDVERVFEHGELIETAGSTTDTLRTDGSSVLAWHWTFPLLIGRELIGVIKLEGLQVSTQPLRDYLPIFFRHLALTLNNEIRSQSRLQQACNELTAANNALQQTQYSIDRAAIAVFWCAPSDGQFMYVNDQACRNLGYHRSELLQLKVCDIDPDWPADRWSYHVTELREQGWLRLESHHRHKSGRIFPVELTVYLNSFAGTENLVSFASDISQRKRDETILRHALDEARSASRTKSTFLANMSHELRTPLNAILGFTQLMADDSNLTEKQKRNLDIIDHSGRHLLSLINDVLEISRIEAGKLQLTPMACDLIELLETVHEMLQARAVPKGLRLDLETTPQLPRFIITDANKLRQILLNLLSNAVKYTEQGSVYLVASTAGSIPSETPVLQFEIRDTGVGMSPDELKHIFEPFYQAEFGSKKGEGTGLGLAICQEYIRLLNGRLEVDSHLGVGSVFRVLLPVHLSDPIIYPSNRPHVLGLAPGQIPPRILVVEDHPAIQQLFAELLSRAGFEYCLASNGLQALDLFSTWRPDFIWMDMRMPVMDGYEATRRIRALPEGGKIPIIAITASAQDGDRLPILRAGCDDILKKPIDMEQFYATLARHLNIQYHYASEPVNAVHTRASLEHLLQGLDEDSRQGLYSAALSLDADAVREIAEHLAPEHAPLLEQLQVWMDNYDFDSLLRAVAPQ